MKDFKQELLLRYKQNRKRAKLSQKQIADAMNKIHGTNYNKSAICNYESSISSASVDRLIDLFNCSGGDVFLLVKESFSWKFSHYISKMEEVDREKLLKLITQFRRESLAKHLEQGSSMEDLESRFFIENYVNKYVDVVVKKRGLTFLFLEPGIAVAKYEYIFK